MGGTLNWAMQGIILALYFNVTDKFTDKNRDSVQVRSKFGLSSV